MVVNETAGVLRIGLRPAQVGGSLEASIKVEQLDLASLADSSSAPWRLNKRDYPLPRSQSSTRIEATPRALKSSLISRGEATPKLLRGTGRRALGAGLDRRHRDPRTASVGARHRNTGVVRRAATAMVAMGQAGNFRPGPKADPGSRRDPFSADGAASRALGALRGGDVPGVADRPARGKRNRTHRPLWRGPDGRPSAGSKGGSRFGRPEGAQRKSRP